MKKRELVATNASIGESGETFGERVRAFRKMRHLSLSQVADAAKVSVSFLSQLERGKTNASFENMRGVADALGVRLSDLFGETEVQPVHVLRRADRPSLTSAPGTLKTMLTQTPIRHLEVFAGEFQPGADTGPTQYVHGDSQELFIVTRGAMTVHIGTSTFEVGEGDCIEYESSQPHRAENRSDDVSEVLWVVTPPTGHTDVSVDAHGTPL